ncbi:MAG TPA: ABC transporter substrate-binding protein [Stellaceae bacterium]|nr:ABC transporter substrate-binding protein [Stellaceae bacterium]
MLSTAWRGPPGNITGTSLMIPELAAKRLQLLKELVPGMSRALVLAVLGDPIGPLQVKAIAQIAGPLGVALQVHDIRTADDIPRAFSDAAKAGVQGVLVTTESIFNVHSAEVTGLAARYKLPAIYGSRYPVTSAGGLMAYAVDGPEMFRAAAGYVDRLLKGTKIAKLPVQQPTRFPLIVNLGTAKALGLTVPPALLARATQVIE